MPDAPDPTSDRAGSATPAADDPGPRYWTPWRVGLGVLLTAVVLGVGYGVASCRDVSAAERLAPVGESDVETRDAPIDEAFDLTGLTVRREQLSHSGLGRDGVPAITDPATVRVADVEAHAWPGDGRVVGVEINGQTRGYPVAILNRHECINDTLGGVPIAVIFCPLCDSVSVVDRRLPGRSEPATFGLAGLLLNSNVVFYDRVDGSLWSQVKLEAISGPHAGQSLIHLANWEIARWDDWRQAYPRATVIQPELEPHDQRDYTTAPFTAYIETDRLMFPIARDDARLPRKTAVVGVRRGDEARAWPTAWVADQPGGRVRETWGGGTVELQADTDGRVGVVAVPGGAAAVHTFWFAWAAFHPQTTLAE